MSGETCRNAGLDFYQGGLGRNLSGLAEGYRRVVSCALGF